jgi:hypothetical protein
MIEQATSGYISGVQGSFTGENDEFIATLFMVERVPVEYVGWLRGE